MENLKKNWTLCLLVGAYKCDVRVKFLYQAMIRLCILPAGMLFCLTLLGCDVQEETSVGAARSEHNISEVVGTQGEVTLSHQSDQLTRSALPRIVAFGDSLTAGLGVDPTDAYPGQLARWLGEQGHAYEVINAGVSGDTTAGGLRRVGWILKNKPSLVILELGANDGLRGQPLQETYNNLSAIIMNLEAEGVMVVLAGMQLPLNYGDEYTQGFSDVFVRLADEHDVPLIPFFLEGVATHPHLNQGDGLHPNSEGYSIVVQNVWRILQPILKELAEKGERKNASLPMRKERQ